MYTERGEGLGWGRKKWKQKDRQTLEQLPLYYLRVEKRGKKKGPHAGSRGQVNTSTAELRSASIAGWPGECALSFRLEERKTTFPMIQLLPCVRRCLIVLLPTSQWIALSSYIALAAIRKNLRSAIISSFQGDESADKFPWPKSPRGQVLFALAISCLFCTELPVKVKCLSNAPWSQVVRIAKESATSQVSASTKLILLSAIEGKISPLLSLQKHVLQLERKHPLQIDVLSLKRWRKVADRGSKCGAIVAVIACRSTCGGSHRDSKRLGQSEWWRSWFTPPAWLCADIWDSWGEDR